MPTHTFLRLPAEKKEKILKAAMQEYARVPSSQVSVKNIVEAAGIPRGSFYAYFDGKDDLGDYLMQEYRDKFYAYIQDIFQKHQGDLFVSMKQFYQALLSQCLADHSNYLKMTCKLVNTDYLRLEQESDLDNIIELCIMLIRNQLAKAMRCNLDYDTACRQFSDKVEILKRGMQSTS